MHNLANSRHDRTELFIKDCKAKNLDKFFSKTILVTGNEKLLASDNGKIMIKTLVNLTSRFTNRIYISLPNSQSTLQAELIDLALKAGAESSNEIPKKIDVVISIGNSSIRGDFGININSDGWVSYLSCNNNVNVFENSMQNPIGAMGAACFGSAEAFKRILEISDCEEKWAKIHPKNFTFSFLTNSLSKDNASLPSDVKINEDVLLVGVGAVGSSFVYALSQIKNLAAAIVTIDNDVFDETSLNRCPICFIEKLGQNKAKVAEEYSTESLRIKSQPIKFNEIKDKLGSNLSLVVSTVDNNEARYQIQSSLPKLIFHGATGQSVANVSIIKFLDNACFCCIYQSNSSREEIISQEMGIPITEVKKALENNEKFTEQHFALMKEKFGTQVDKFQKFVGLAFEDVYKKEVCGKMEIKTKDGTRTSSVSFVSFFSGLSLAAELIKFHSDALRQYPMNTKEAFLRINLLLPETIIFAHRPKDPNCSLNCSSDTIKNIYSKKWNIFSGVDPIC
jgi:molybdopterin/thiamine biosynthesis adenylyltransferase